MSKKIEKTAKIADNKAPRPLPPDLDALLREATGRERACVILPPECGHMLLGLEFLRRQKAPSLLVARHAASADRWEARWRETADGRGTRGMPAISRDLPEMAPRTVTDHAALRRMGRDDRIRLLSEALRAKRGLPLAILIEDPYALGEVEREVLTRICESVASIRILSIASHPPVDRTPEEREACEAVCGSICGAVGIPAMVQKGVLRPHRDFLYLSDPTTAPDALSLPFQAIIDSRTERIRRLTSLPIMAHACDRLLRQSRGYLYRRRSDVQAVACLLHARSPRAAKRLMGILGGHLHDPTEKDMDTAIAYLLQSQAVLSTEEKDVLRRVCAEAADLPGAVCSERGEAFRCASRSAVKIGDVCTILAAEEAVLGNDMRALVVVSPEDGERCLEDLFRRGRTAGAYRTAEAIYLPDTVKIKSRLHHLCRGSMRIMPWPERPRYLMCRSDRPADIDYAAEMLFAGGDIRVLLSDGQLPSGGSIERAANVLILTTPTERGENNRSDAPPHYASTACEVRDRALAAQRDNRYAGSGHGDRGLREDIDRQALHIWHIAALGTVHGSVAEDADECEAVRRFLLCTPSTGWEIPPHIPSTFEELEAYNAAVLSEIPRCRATPQASDAHSSTEEPRLSVTIPAAAGLPSVTPMRMMKLGSAVLGLGIGGYLLPHLIRLTLQAQGMAAVLGIFLGLTALCTALFLAGGIHLLRTLPYLIRHRTAHASVQSLASALLRALRETGRVGEAVTIRVEFPPVSGHPAKETRRLILRVEQATYTEADCICRAIGEMLSPLRAPRYLICQNDRTWKRIRAGKRGRAVVLACPSVLARHDADIDTLVACLGKSLGRAARMYTRRGGGIEALDAARARNYRREGGGLCEVWVHL